MQLSLIETILYAFSFVLSEILPFDQRFISSTLLSLFQSSSDLSLQNASLLITQGYLYWILAAVTFLFFRHEWSSMISSLIKLLIFRKKPEAMDERIPLYILIAVLPSVFLGLFFGIFKNPPYLLLENLYLGSLAYDFRFAAFLFLTGAVFIWFVDNSARKIKGLYDFNAMDAVLYGCFLTLTLIPGFGFILLGMIYLIFRGYQREVALKFTYFCSFLYFLARALQLTYYLPDLTAPFSWSQLSALTEMPVLNLVLFTIVAIGVSIMAISSYTKAIQKLNITRLLVVRILIILIFVSVWYFQQPERPSFSETSQIGKLNR